MVVHEDKRYNAPDLFCHKGHKPVSIVEKLAFLKMHVETGEVGTGTSTCLYLYFVYVLILKLFFQTLNYLPL